MSRDGSVPPTGEVAQNFTPGPTLASAPRVSGTNLTAKCTGLAEREIVLVDGIPFASPAKLKHKGAKVVQRSPLLTGATLDSYLRSRRQAFVTFRKQDGGTTRVAISR